MERGNSLNISRLSKEGWRERIGSGLIIDFIHSASSSALGPNWGVCMAEWIKDRSDGKPMELKNVPVDLTGQTHVFETPRR